MINSIKLKTNIKDYYKNKNSILELLKLQTKDLLFENKLNKNIQIENIQSKNWHISSKYSTIFIFEIKIKNEELYNRDKKIELLKSIYLKLKEIETNINLICYISIYELESKNWKIMEIINDIKE